MHQLEPTTHFAKTSSDFARKSSTAVRTIRESNCFKLRGDIYQHSKSTVMYLRNTLLEMFASKYANFINVPSLTGRQDGPWTWTAQKSSELDGCDGDGTVANDDRINWQQPRKAL